MGALSGQSAPNPPGTGVAGGRGTPSPRWVLGIKLLLFERALCAFNHLSGAYYQIFSKVICTQYCKFLVNFWAFLFELKFATNSLLSLLSHLLRPSLLRLNIATDMIQIPKDRPRKSLLVEPLSISKLS